MKSKAGSAKAFGICLGASTISAVEVIKEGNDIKIGRIIRKEHDGNPREIFGEVVNELNTGDAPVLVTGRRFRSFVSLPSVTEPEAVESALHYIHTRTGSTAHEKYDALVSAGGETFMVYRLDDDQRIVGISTGNKCASGTGEFFLQQIKRMDLTIEKAVEAAVNGDPYSVSGRCSVFCKSDCTHALNKGVPVSDVTAGLCEMIASKIIELVVKIPHNRVLVTGGTALNAAVIKHVKKHLKHIHVPEEAPYFEALGAAIAAFDKGEKAKENLFKEGESSFNPLPSLKEAESLVVFNEFKHGKVKDGDECIVGLDVGSTTTKATLMRLSDEKVLASIYLRTNGQPVEASRKCFESLIEQTAGVKFKVTGIGVTGSGRQIAGLYALTDGIINEIIAHASAAVYFDPEVDTIFEIGGQDAKYTHLTNGVASDYAMNEACSAGTGSFLEEAAYESLGVDYREIADLAIKGVNPPNFNDQCAAFISSDIKNATHEGISRNDILAGLVYSICFNYTNRVKGHRPVGNKIFMQGGVCYNKAVPLAMASIMKKQIIVPPDPGMMGAFGVALELKKRLNLGLIEKKEFDLKAIIGRKVVNEKPFICAGGKEKCDLKCSINMIRIEEKVYPFGGACNRYYNQRFSITVDDKDLDLVKARNELAFGKYSPPAKLPAKAPVIGINKSLIVYQLFPLYYNFFTTLGCKVVTSTEVVEEATHRHTTSFCYPAQVSIGLFDSLISLKPDFYFMPHTEELPVEGGMKRKEFSSTCIFTQGEAFWMRQIFKDKLEKEKVLSPTLNFANGFDKETENFIKIGKKLGFSAKKSRAAFEKAIKVQQAYRDEKKEMGRLALEELHKHPEKIAIVLFGPPHNALSDETNKGIPKKLTSRGYMIMPFDILPTEKETIEDPHEDYMHWEMGQKIIRGSQIVKKDPQLFGLYITNFLCAIDSLLVTYFRRIMKSKPSLTLEIDGHTADAGIDTRVEAYLDVIKNYNEVQKKAVAKTADTFVPAIIDVTASGMFFVDSKGKKFALTDPNVKLIIPNMGDTAALSLAAVFRNQGIRAEGMPVSDREALRLGRSVTTGKECLPMVLCIGSMLRYLKHRTNPNEKLVVFQPRAAGYCRLGQYHVYMNMLIKERKLEDVALLSLANEERYTGVGPTFTLNAWKGLLVADVMDDVRNAIWTIATDPVKGEKIFDVEYDKLMQSLDGSSKVDFYRQLKASMAELKKIPKKVELDKTPEVAVVGEIFVRRDSFSNKDIAKRLAEKGYIAKVGHLTEWLYYLNYMIKHKLHVPDYTMLGWLEFVLSDATQRFVEVKVKKIIAESGFYNVELVDIEDIIRYSEHIVPKDLKGEPGLIMGITLRDIFSKYAGIVNIGPFSCMPVRFTEAIMANSLDMKSREEAYKSAGKAMNNKSFRDTERIPFLTIEADGNPYPQLLEARFESFCLQAGRIAKTQGKELYIKELAVKKV